MKDRSIESKQSVFSDIKVDVQCEHCMFQVYPRLQEPKSHSEETAFMMGVTHSKDHIVPAKITLKKLTNHIRYGKYISG